MVEAHTFITEERLQTLIKNIFIEEFQKQEKNIINIISSNFEVAMKEIKDLKAEVSDLKDRQCHRKESRKTGNRLYNLEDKCLNHLNLLNHLQ